MSAVIFLIYQIYYFNDETGKKLFTFIVGLTDLSWTQRPEYPRNLKGQFTLKRTHPGALQKEN